MDLVQIFAGWNLEDLSLVAQLSLLLIPIVFYGLPILIIVMIVRIIRGKKKNEKVWHYDEASGQLIDYSQLGSVENTIQLKEVDHKEDSKLKVIIYIIIGILALNTINFLFAFFNINLSIGFGI